MDVNEVPLSTVSDQEPEAFISNTKAQDQDDQLSRDLDDWIKKFNSDFNKEDFDFKVEEFSSFLANAIHSLPGPKNPATKYFNARKSGNLKKNDRTFQDSKNPERKSKRDREKRRERFLYQRTQFLYYNQRKKAVNMVLNRDTPKCRIATDILHETFSNRFSETNDTTRETYQEKTSEQERLAANETFKTRISPEQISDAIRGIKIDTAPGPDRVLMRVVKCERVVKVLALIASKMMQYGWVPKCFKRARTILIYKDGDKQDPNNWRPITIFSVLRRVIERALDKLVRSYVSLNEHQRGFTNTPGSYINVSIVGAILEKLKKRKESATLVFLDISKAFDNIGHKHLSAAIRQSCLPVKLQDLIIELQADNIIQIEANNAKTKPIIINRGVMQGAPLSPSLYNMATDHILDELSERDVSRVHGYILLMTWIIYLLWVLQMIRL